MWGVVVLRGSGGVGGWVCGVCECGGLGEGGVGGWVVEGVGVWVVVVWMGGVGGGGL